MFAALALAAVLHSAGPDSPPCDAAAGIVTDCVQMQAPEEHLGGAIDCPDGTVGYVVDVNGGTSCATAAPAPAPSAAPAPSVLDLPDGTSVEVPAAEPYAFSFTDLLEALRGLFGGFLAWLLHL